jgi:subtilisin-like proprotein convertase family protein
LGGLAIGLMATTTALPAQAVVFTSPPGTYNIPDQNATGISVPINVANTDTITNFNGVTISGLSHTYYADLKATLSNGATTVTLFNCSQFVCTGGASFTNDTLVLNGNYTFANTGSDWYAQTTDPVPTGTYQSLNALSAFNGQSLNGTWTLTVTDNGLNDTGSFTGWSFDVNANPPEPIPFEFSPNLGLIILGIGYGSTQAWKRWRNSKPKFDLNPETKGTWEKGTGPR